jgi:phosphoenolpyruvate carboxylase
LVAAVVAGKVALSEFYRFSEERGIPVFPAIGVGTLPFRGSLSPERIADFIAEYPGMKTVYVQSAFRYDFPRTTAAEAIHELNTRLQKTLPRRLSAGDIKDAETLVRLFSAPYRKTVEALAHTINNIAKQVPSRRERKLHTGLFGYSRGIGKKKLPRAIPFTASLYTLGVPPEFIGTGRGLAATAKAGIDVERFYKNLRTDLLLAGPYLNRDNLHELARHSAAWREIQADIALVEKHLGISVGPLTREDNLYQSITSTAYQHFKSGKPLDGAIVESGKIRRSLG